MWLTLIRGQREHRWIRSGFAIQPIITLLARVRPQLHIAVRHEPFLCHAIWIAITRTDWIDDYARPSAGVMLAPEKFALFESSNIDTFRGSEGVSPRKIIIVE